MGQPWAPEAEQRAFLVDNEAAEHGPDSNITSAVQRVRQQIADRDWERWPQTQPAAEPKPQ